MRYSDFSGLNALAQKVDWYSPTDTTTPEGFSRAASKLYPDPYEFVLDLDRLKGEAGACRSLIANSVDNLDLEKEVAFMLGQIDRACELMADRARTLQQRVEHYAHMQDRVVKFMDVNFPAMFAAMVAPLKGASSEATDGYPYPWVILDEETGRFLSTNVPNDGDGPSLCEPLANATEFENFAHAHGVVLANSGPGRALRAVPRKAAQSHADACVRAKTDA